MECSDSKDALATDSSERDATAAQTLSHSISLDVSYLQDIHSLTLPYDATLTDLSNLITTTFDIPAINQKFLITPKPGLLRPPFPGPTLALSTLLPPSVPTQPKIRLLGATATAISTLNATLAANTRARTLRAQSHALARRSPSAASAPRISPRSSSPSAASTYTFASIAPLPHLPSPQRSLALLQRVAADPGIIAAMKHFSFRVGLLTEMDPAAHTTREGRTLGLNRNSGEVIELRLWTDDFAGFRDYGTVRRTLCHELAHNVYGEHDGDFWRLMKEIEGVVERGDWKSGGRVVGGEGTEYSVDAGGMVGRGASEDDDVDGGGWTGGSYVLGGTGGDAGLNRRDVLARAAEGRTKQLLEKNAQPPYDKATTESNDSKTS